MVGLLLVLSASIRQDNFPPVPAPPLLLRNVTVISCVGSRINQDTDVFIENGRIRQISKKIDIAKLRPTGFAPTGYLPSMVTVVEAKGKFLIPGLWDMHVHGTGVPGFLNVYIANGVVGVRDMFDPSLGTVKLGRDVEAGNTVGPHIISGGKIVDGPKPVWGGSIAVANPEDGRKAVDTVIKDGSDFVKVYSLLSRESYLAIADESKKKKIVFAGHVPEEVSASEASDVGQKTFEHLYGILKACSSKANDKTPTRLLGLPREKQREVLQSILDTYDEKRAQSLFKKLKKNNTWQCPTINVLEAISRPKESREWTEYRFDYLPVWFRNVWATYKDRSKDWTPADYELNEKYFQKQLDVVRDMHKAGVPLLAGTDVMNPYCFPGFSLHDELRWFVKAGIKPYDVLKIATVNPAKFLGRQKDFGTVERGRVADLVLLDADPLADISNTTKVNSVILRGKLYDRSALDRLMPKTSVKVQNVTPLPQIVAGFLRDEH